MKLQETQPTSFSQKPNAAESLQMTMNHILSSNKPLMGFSGTDPDYSVIDCLNAITAILNLNIGPEPVKTPLCQNWIHRRTNLIQTTLDGASRKLFSVLPIDIKSDLKRFTTVFSERFNSERTNNFKEIYKKNS